MPGAVTLPGNNGVREPPLGVTGIIFKHNSKSFAYQVSISTLHVLNFIFCQVLVIYKYSSAIWTFFLWSRKVIFSVSMNLTLTLKIICQCDIIHIMTLPIKIIMSDFKVLTYIITSISARPTGLAAILVIMSVSTFISDFILYLLLRSLNKCVNGITFHIVYFLIQKLILNLKVIQTFLRESYWHIV